MRPFTQLRGIAAALPLANVDTDMITPAMFLKTVSKRGLSLALFHAQRFDAQGAERPEFVLNQEPWRRAEILVALENFGCGSSREHAPWALLDFGIRCVIAPSFAEIFRNNCFKNGILALILPQDRVEALLADAADPRRATVSVDLQAGVIARSDASTLRFHVEPQLRKGLLQGRDDIDRSLAEAPAIDRYEAAMAIRTPWLTAIPADL